MPFVLIIIGSVLAVAGVRDTLSDTDATGTSGEATPGLYTLIKNDFTGPNNFVFWVLSILLLGALGYIDAVRPLSRAFLVLVIVILFLKQGNGFLQSFTKQITGEQTK